MCQEGKFSAQSETLHFVSVTERVNACVTDMQDTEELPFIYTQGKGPNSHSALPSNPGIILKGLLFSLKIYLGVLFFFLGHLNFAKILKSFFSSFPRRL